MEGNNGTALFKADENRSYVMRVSFLLAGQGGHRQRALSIVSVDPEHFVLCEDLDKINQFGFPPQATCSRFVIS